MRVSWKTSAGLFILALAGGGGCAAGSEGAASDGETLMAPQADDANAPPEVQGAPGDVTVNIDVNENGSNDTGHSCGHHHHHHHHHGGSAQGSPGDNAPSPPPAPSPDPAAPPVPPVPPVPPSPSGPPGPG